MCYVISTNNAKQYKICLVNDKISDDRTVLLELLPTSDVLGQLITTEFLKMFQFPTLSLKMKPGLMSYHFRFFIAIVEDTFVEFFHSKKIFIKNINKH